MASVYHISIGKFMDGKPDNGMNVYTRIVLIDGATDQDDWMTDPGGSLTTLGKGGGDWIRRSSTKSIILADDHMSSIDAVMNYDSWPLKQHQHGTIRLNRPLGNAKNDSERATTLDYSVWEVR